MADDSSSTPRPFDVQTIKYLVELMREHDLSEIDLREGELRIRLRRGPAGVVALPNPGPPIIGSGPVPPPPPPSRLVEVKSPAPGTFYSAPKPDAEPYVRRGAKVTPTSPVGVLEAMKVYTDILAECSGVIEEVLVENQQAVEYNQVLFRVDPTG